MVNFDHSDSLIAEENPTPDLCGYQKRVVEQGADELVERDGDLLVEAPTGAGKTPMLARLAKEVCERRENGKVLILTHRRNLLRQMAGNPRAETVKAQKGEILFWAGEAPGTIAEKGLGGINQDPRIVVAMVETAANLEGLAEFTDIFIDETHHASEESASRDDAGSYAKIIEKLPDAKVTGVTATSFRGDEDELHPRLKNARRIVIGTEETEQEGRTVRAKTVVSKARLENGMTPTELYAAEREGRLDRSASAIMRESKGDAYYKAAMQEWAEETGKTSTIAFTDSTDEVDLVAEYYNKTFGPGTAGVISGKYSDKQNDAAMEAYARGEITVLVSCKMIGEGYDVPGTNNIQSFNSSISRGEMNQIVGRATRSADGKTEGKFIDCGTSTARHGLVEEQHKIQSVRAMALSGNRIEATRSLGRATAAKGDDWNAVPGEKESLFFRRNTGGKYEAFRIEHGVMKNDGRRVLSDQDAGRRLQRVFGPDDAALMDVHHIAGMIGEHMQKEAGFIARAGGLKGDVYRAKGRMEMDAWKKQLDVLSPDGKLEGVVRTPSAQEREEAIRKAVRGEERSQVGLRAVALAIEKTKSPIEGLRESIHLTGIALGEMAKSEETPIGLRQDSRAMAYNLAALNVKDMKSSELMPYAAMLKTTLGFAGAAGLPESQAKVTKSLMGSMQVSEDRIRAAEEKKIAQAR